MFKDENIVAVNYAGYALPLIYELLDFQMTVNMNSASTCVCVCVCV